MENLIYRVDNHIGYLTLNRWDKYNAFDGQLIDEFEQFWRERRYDDSVRVIILDGGRSQRILRRTGYADPRSAIV